MKDFLSGVFDLFGRSCWIKVVTANPDCTYYFGPYANKGEAEAELPGFIEDLRGEGANILSTSIQREKPTELTIYDESVDVNYLPPRPVLSGQP